MRAMRLELKNGRKTNRKRGRSEEGVSWTVMRPFLIGIVVFVALLFILIFAPWVFRKGVFVMNKAFVLRQFDIEGGETLTPPLVRELLEAETVANRVMIGMPLFGFDLERTRREFLLRAPNIKNMRMTRVLPDTLVIRIVERRPILRIGAGGFVADSEGIIFSRYVSVNGLPRLTGVERADLAEGSELSGLARAAVFLITCLDETPVPLPVTGVDLANSDYLVLTLIDQKQVLFAWDGMLDPQCGGEAGIRVLRTQLRGLAEAINSPSGRNRRFWNATVKGRFSAAE